MHHESLFSIFALTSQGAFGAHTNIPLLYKEVAPGAKTPNWGRTQAGKVFIWIEVKVCTVEQKNKLWLLHNQDVDNEGWICPERNWMHVFGTGGTRRLSEDDEGWLLEIGSFLILCEGGTIHCKSAPYVSRSSLGL